MNYLATELKRSLFSKRFLIAAIITLIAFFVGPGQEYMFAQSAGVLQLVWVTRTTLTILIAPILATIPYSGSYSIERNHKFLPNILLRVSKIKYIWTKILVAGLMGGLVLTIPHLIYVFSLSAIFPVIPLTNNCGGPLGYLMLTSPWQYIFWINVLTFAFGFVYGIMGLALSTLFRQTFFAYIMPFVLYMIPSFIFPFLSLVRFEPGTTWHPGGYSNITLASISGQLLILLVLSIILFSYQVYRWDNNNA